MTDEEVRYVVDDDPDRLDLDVIWGFLSTEAYWLRWRTRDDVERQVRGAWRVVGAYREDTGEQVGFARAVSDGVSDAYLADVFVLPEHRGHGLGQRIVETMVEQGPGVRFRWTLATRDAHGLYARFGFLPPDSRTLVRPPREESR